MSGDELARLRALITRSTGPEWNQAVRACIEIIESSLPPPAQVDERVGVLVRQLRELADYLATGRDVSGADVLTVRAAADLLESLAARLAAAERALLVLHVNTGGRSEEEHMEAVKFVTELVAARTSRAGTTGEGM